MRAVWGELRAVNESWYCPQCLCQREVGATARFAREGPQQATRRTARTAVEPLDPLAGIYAARPGTESRARACGSALLYRRETPRAGTYRAREGQNSSNFTGSVRLPSTSWVPLSSVV